jgi:hypothetical protein
LSPELSRFDLLGYRRAVAEYNRNWQATDETLYDLCRRFPGHSDQASVKAKLWIIGRTYATGIERKIPTQNTQGSSLSQLSEHILSHRRKAEFVFRRLAQITEPLTPEKLRRIVDAHGQFVRLLQPLLRHRQSPRSFASKYMHFHCSAVPLYDTYAVTALRHLYPWQEAFEIFDLPASADEEYTWHAMRFWQLYQDAQKRARWVTVKLLDYYLLRVAEDF